MTFTQTLITSQNKQIYKICETAASGDRVWFVVHISKQKLSAFLKIPKGRSYKVQDYGTVLKWGYGDDVPESALAEISDQAG